MQEEPKTLNQALLLLLVVVVVVAVVWGILFAL
jgi:hypothetical protein